MRHAFFRRGALGATALLCAFLPVTTGSAEPTTYEVGDLVVERPWTRATPGGAPVAGGFMRITNTGSEPDRLVGGDFEASARFEVHRTTMTDGVMRMAPVAGGLPILPGETVELAPGGLHVMFMGLERQLAEGERVAGTLVFESAGPVSVSYTVEAMGVRQPGHAHGDGGHGSQHRR